MFETLRRHKLTDFSFENQYGRRIGRTQIGWNSVYSTIDLRLRKKNIIDCTLFTHENEAKTLLLYTRPQMYCCVFHSSPLSSMVFGTNALFTKPAQSLAPMLVLSILNQFEYERLKDASQDADHRLVLFFVLDT